MRMTSGRALGIALVMLLLPAMAAAGTTQSKSNEKDVYWATTLFVPCALDGAGENVSAAGFIHFTEHLLIDAAGNWHYRWQGDPQGLKGVGETSGDVYNFTGKTSYGEKGSTLPYTASYVNNFHVVGSAGNYLVRTRFHVTIRPDGETAVSIDGEEVTCH